jgi:hypothetical protein
MTLDEWSTTITAELRAAGFNVELYQRFPLVEIPILQSQFVKLLKFKTSMPADREIYGEGMLFMPAGSRRAAQELHSHV